MTALAWPESAAAGPFLVTLPAYQGDLGGLAAALRAGRVLLPAVPLLTLTRALLAHVRQVTGPDAPPELLPALAAVIALKARLLLPRAPDLSADPAPGSADEEGPEDWPVDWAEQLAGEVETLANLDGLVAALARRREARALLLPAQPRDLGLPRRERTSPSAGRLDRLVRAARTAVRDVQVPLLARERLTVQDALYALRTFAARLRTFVLGSVQASTWADQTTYFAALLEGVKTGDFAAEQTELYGPITVRSLRPDSENRAELGDAE